MHRTALLGLAGAVLLVASALLAPTSAAAPPTATAERVTLDATDPDGGRAPSALREPAPSPGPDTRPDDVAAPAPEGTRAAMPGETAHDEPAAGASAGTDEGLLVAPGRAPVGTGPLLTYTVEVEAATGLDPAAAADAVRTALEDPRSWGRIRTLQQVDRASRAMARIIIARPATVDALCAEAGLDTAGIYSCWNGRVVALNAWRWEVGADGFPDIATYRTYLVNHEVGHVLGRGHVACPGPGAPAPLMMQQSKGLAGCTANGWPFP